MAATAAAAVADAAAARRRAAPRRPRAPRDASIVRLRHLSFRSTLERVARMGPWMGSFWMTRHFPGPYLEKGKERKRGKNERVGQERQKRATHHSCSTTHFSTPAFSATSSSVVHLCLESWLSLREGWARVCAGAGERGVCAGGTRENRAPAVASALRCCIHSSGACAFSDAARATQIPLLHP